MTKVKKIKEFFKRVFWVIGENYLLTFFILISLALLIGGFIFYQYSFLISKLEPQTFPTPLQFDQALYQNILEQWQTRQKKFDEAELKEYPDLFQSRVPIPEEELTE